MISQQSIASVTTLLSTFNETLDQAFLDMTTTSVEEPSLSWTFVLLRFGKQQLLYSLRMNVVVVVWFRRWFGRRAGVIQKNPGDSWIGPEQQNSDKLHCIKYRIFRSCPRSLGERLISRVRFGCSVPPQPALILPRLNLVIAYGAPLLLPSRFPLWFTGYSRLYQAKRLRPPENPPTLIRPFVKVTRLTGAAKLSYSMPHFISHLMRGVRITVSYAAAFT